MIAYLFYPILLLIGIAATTLFFKARWKKLGEDFGRYAAAYRQALTSGQWQKPGVTVPSVLDEGLQELVHLAETITATPDRGESETSNTTGEVDSKERLNNTLIINELGQKITSSLKLDETFEHLSHTLSSMMDASILELGVYDPKSEEWQVFSNREQPYQGEYYNHFADWVRRNNRAVFLNDVALDFGRFVDRPLELKTGEAAQSLMSFPISIQNEVRGTISVMSLRKNAFDAYHEESIGHLLNFLAVALQNAFIHEQLNLLKIRAEESEKHEQQFLANMSHEIRTPMNAILGMTHLLLDSTLNEKQRNYLSAINTSSKNLLVIINDILDLSKLEAGKMEIEKIPFRVRDVFQNVSDTSKFKAEEKGLHFEINISPDLPEVLKGDPTRLNQILTNLSSNAIKFTEKGRVTISADMPIEGKTIRFRVIDTGIGIPNDKLHLLFGNFKQVDSSTFRKYGGTGLGLSISKTLIELQGGKVNVKSEVGVGSEFMVEIPYELGSEADVKAMETVVADYTSLRGIRILIAEDNEYNQIVVHDTLESLIDEVHIDIAENGLIALEKLASTTYDVVLMDAQMPEMDGLDATRAIRKMEDPIKRDIPILALTASVHKADINKCIDAGMNDFVPKPFTRDELLGAISKFYHNENPGQVQKKVQKTADSDENKTSVEAAEPDTVTDMHFLTEFTEGNGDRMKKYIGLYLKLLPDNIAKMEEALEKTDYEALVKVIHAMRPHLNYMGMKAAARHAAVVEDSVREQKNLEFVDEKSHLILAHCRKSKEELQPLLT